MNSGIKDYQIIFSIEKAFTVNRTIAFLKKIPLIKRLFKGNNYSRPVLKAFVSVYAFFAEIFKNFLFKGIYGAMIIGATVFITSTYGSSGMKMMEKYGPQVSIMIYLLFTLVGALMNNNLFELDEDKYSVVFLMRMDAKKNVLINYTYTMIKFFVGHLVLAIAFVIWSGYNPLFVILMPLFGIGLKLLLQGIQVKLWKRNRNFTSGFMFGGYGVSLTILALAAIVVIAVLKLFMPEYAVMALMCTVILAGFIFGITALKNYDDYRIAYKKVTEQSFEAQATVVDAQKQKNKDILVMDEADTLSEGSKGKGLRGFNEVFMKRHKKILWKRTMIISIVIAVLYVIIAAGCLFTGNFFGELSNLSDGAITKVILTMVFICYFINGGESVTSAMYMNCDHSMLTYSFYKEPKKILELFRLRALSIIKLNIIPGIMIGCGFASIIAITGGTHNYINYVAAIAAPIVISIFFSVHYLTIYYLLQPYDSNSDAKSPLYSVINTVTYIVSYLTMQIEVSGMIFVEVVVAFCIVYILLACFLVYKLAPKTFRIHK